MNIFDYLEMHKDKNFNEYGFNDIDNVILSQLSYLPFSGIVPPMYGKGITLTEASDLFFKKFSKSEIKNSWYLIPPKAYHIYLYLYYFFLKILSNL